MSEGWEEPTESAGEDRGGNEGSWNDDKNVEGEKAGDGWGENVEKESGVGRGEEGDEEVVPVADREGEEATGHAEDDLGNGEGWGENGQKESAGTMENGKDSGDSNERNEGESRRERAPPEVNQMFTLKVDNLPYSVTARELKEEFERFGEIGDVFLPKVHYTGEPRGFSFVRFIKKDDAENALNDMNSKEFQGRELRIQFARQPRPNNPRQHFMERERQMGYGGGGGGGGYNRGYRGSGSGNDNRGYGGGGYRGEGGRHGGGYNEDRYDRGGGGRDRYAGRYNDDRHYDRGGRDSYDGGGKARYDERSYRGREGGRERTDDRHMTSRDDRYPRGDDYHGGGGREHRRSSRSRSRERARR